MPRSRTSDHRALRVEDAEVIGLRALAFLGESGALAQFCRTSGIAEPELRSRAGEPEVLGAVLDFLLAHEDRLVAFCDWAELPPEVPQRARYLLPGA